MRRISHTALSTKALAEVPLAANMPYATIPSPSVPIRDIRGFIFSFALLVSAMLYEVICDCTLKDLIAVHAILDGESPDHPANHGCHLQ